MSPALAVLSWFLFFVPILGVPFFFIWAIVGERIKVKPYWLYLLGSIPAFIVFLALLFAALALVAYLGDTSKPELFNRP